MSDGTATKPKHPKARKYMLVRYGRMRQLGLFEHNETDMPKTPMRVVVKTERGLELGEVVGGFGCYRSGQFRLGCGQIEKYFKDSGIKYNCKVAGSFQRYATAEDVREERHLRRIAAGEMEFCSKLVEEMGLPMRIVGAEHIFGGERVIFYFIAAERVDFRDLVKKLAREYQSRIEMRQVGARDEARLLGDMETCGQECCCIRFLRALKPVNMRMAKLQKATLDPAKIGGYCGRLKCCLRYEDRTYNELRKQLPPKNAVVRCGQGTGRVLDAQILTQLVLVEKADGSRFVVAVEDIEKVSPGPGGGEAETEQEPEESDGPENGEGGPEPG
jgi:cell fate regulator YaaT (PSP1 superfamily)